MDESKIDKFKAAGTPNKFIREIKSAYRLRLTRWGVWTVVFAFLLLPIFAIGLGLAYGIEAINTERALELLDRVDGYLIYQNIGLGGLVGIFGWIFFVGTLGALVVRVLPGQHRLAGLYTLVESEKRWSIDTRAIRWAVDTAHPNDDSVVFAGKVAMRYARSMALIAAPFFFVGFALAIYEIGNYAIVGERGIYRDDGDQLYPWSDIDFVEVGCNETKDDSHIIYQIHFTDGWDINLANGDPIGTTLLEALERIDDSVMVSGKEFRLWKWLSRNPMHPACLRHYQNSWSIDEYQRLMIVLHVDELT